MVLRRAALALVLLLAGCGVQRHGLVVPTAPVSARPVVATSAARPPTPSATAAASSRPYLGDALLTRDDLPAGWTVQPVPEVTDPRPGQGGCSPYDALTRPPGQRAVITFSSGDSTLQEAILATTVPETKRQLALFRQVAEKCLTVTVHSDGGDSYMLEVSEPKQIVLGDDSYTLRLGGEYDGYMTTVMVRHGANLLMATSFVETPDSPLLAKFAQDAYAKMRRTLG